MGRCVSVYIYVYVCISVLRPLKNNVWDNIYKNCPYSIWLKYRPIVVNNIPSIGALYKTKF